SLFLPEGKTVVTTKGRNNLAEEVYRSLQKNPNVRAGTYYPITILLNRYSASASEIVAAALQDHGRAIIIGERSYGKGSVQNVILLENDTSALKLTTASYWRPSGKNIHRFPDKKDFESAKIDPDEWGVKPDAGMEVPMKDADRVEWMTWRSDRDVVRAKPKAAEKDKDGKPKPPYVDRVL